MNDDRRLDKGHVLLWMGFYVLSTVVGFLDEGGLGALAMIGWTLIPGIVLGYIGLIWPFRWLRFPMASLTVTHLAVGLGLHPKIWI